jgi:acetyl-CoA carboxylase biotin carboxylase subunit
VAEEAPAPLLAADLRAAVHDAAVAFGSRLGYTGLGTVEFLVDPGSGTFYFLEMNARIQVEHPVTEQVCGLDLVAEQIAVAEGRPLSLAQAQVTVTGHAIECRICAEDAQGRPAPGTITRAVFPAGPGIRVDTWIQAGSVVSPFYDSLLAKLIVTGAGRADAVRRLQRALAGCEIAGVITNLPLLAALAGDPAFAAGGVDTGFLARLTGRTPAVAHG